jgi:outer membrane biosynthesis protein TonB
MKNAPMLLAGLRGSQLLAVRVGCYKLGWRMRRASILLLLITILPLAGCKKKPKTTPQPQAQAPTITQPEETKTAEAPPKEPPADEKPAEAPPTTATTTPPPKPKPRPKRSATNANASTRTTQPKPPTTPPTTQAPAQAPQQQASNTPPKTSSTPADVAPPSIPNLPPDDVLHARGTTDQLLAATEGNLRNLKRQLNPDEQQMLAQCRNYMQQAKTAQTDGDNVRARNLALKAHLLSDALITP